MNGGAIFLLALWIFLAFIVGSMAATKGRSRAAWTVLGLLFGVPALIVLFLLDSKPNTDPELNAGQTRKEGWVVSIPYETSDTKKAVLASLKELKLPTQRSEKIIDVGPYKDREDAIQLRTLLIETYAIQGKLDWKAIVS